MTQEYHEADLHTHTYYSDGRASPAQVVDAAVARGLRWLAITDHDTARGSREAAPHAVDAGITLIPAMEFTCRWDACKMPPGETDIDILGYYLDLESPVLREAEKNGLRDFDSRVEIWCALLSADCCPVSLRDVYAENPRYAGTAQLIAAVAAKCGDRIEAERLVRKHMKSVPPAHRTVEEAIAVIHSAGGAAVLAHPTTRYIRWDGERRLDAEGLALLVDRGLDGVEVHHPKISPDDREHFLSLAKEFQLVATGGSDSHESADEEATVGEDGVESNTVEEIARRACRHQA